MGSIIVRDLVNSSDVERMVVGDLDRERAKQLIKTLRSEKVSFESLDVRNKEALTESMKKVNAVANSTCWYEFNLDVTRSAIEAGTNLLTSVDSFT